MVYGCYLAKTRSLEDSVALHGDFPDRYVSGPSPNDFIARESRASYLYGGWVITTTRMFSSALSK
jgi:hypothetical protein